MHPQSETHELLLFVIIQDQDVEPAQSSLQEINLRYSSLPSIGGFLERKNSTFLIGCSQVQLPAVKYILRESCHQRIEYVAIPLDNNYSSASIMSQVPVSVGGAALFSFEVEYQEEI